MNQLHSFVHVHAIWLTATMAAFLMAHFNASAKLPVYIRPYPKNREESPFYLLILFLGKEADIHSQASSNLYLQVVNFPISEFP